MYNFELRKDLGKILESNNIATPNSRQDGAAGQSWHAYMEEKVRDFNDRYGKEGLLMDYQPGEGPILHIPMDVYEYGKLERELQDASMPGNVFVRTLGKALEPFFNWFFGWAPMADDSCGYDQSSSSGPVLSYRVGEASVKITGKTQIRAVVNYFRTKDYLEGQRILAEIEIKNNPLTPLINALITRGQSPSGPTSGSQPGQR
jgi:hypothetical protein